MSTNSIFKALLNAGVHVGTRVRDSNSVMLNHYTKGIRHDRVLLDLEQTIIGLNTGCGERWKTRLWPKEYWIELIKDLEQQGYFCLLMGGSQEDKMNIYYAQQTNASYLGHFSLEEFIAMTNNIDHLIN